MFAVPFSLARQDGPLLHARAIRYVAVDPMPPW